MNKIDKEVVVELKAWRELGYDVVSLLGDRVVIGGSREAKRLAAWRALAKSKYSLAEKRWLVRDRASSQLPPYVSPHLSEPLRVLRWAKVLGYTVKGV